MKKIIDYFNEEAAVHDDHFLLQMGMAKFYDEIEKQLNICKNKNKILILGCGTGLEIERIKFDCNVTAIDLSPDMIRETEKKQYYKGMKLKTVCASILNYDFGVNEYDIVLTCYTLHHFNVAQKLELYKKIHKCLRANGVLINGDTMAKSEEAQNNRLREAENEYSAENLPFGSLHIDVPLTFEKEVSLLNEAEFQNVDLVKEWTKTKIFRCVKL